MTDGVDSRILAALQQALDKEGAKLVLVAPTIGGVTDSNGDHVEAQEKVDGGPSVLFDAVAVLPSAEGAQHLSDEGTARDFVSDAHAHVKFVAYTPEAMPLFEKAGLAGNLDGGYFDLGNGATADEFVVACRELRYWEQESDVNVS